MSQRRRFPDLTGRPTAQLTGLCPFVESIGFSPGEVLAVYAQQVERDRMGGGVDGRADRGRAAVVQALLETLVRELTSLSR
ncbi:hypothetical protein OG381_46170 [Streptomyces sp. NBC_00490]|uniref:hypothetical protein n=1 Tax=Streptomyces sp. NBC_00490 TaxID=2903657 RepID=UPI002E170AE4